MERFTLNNRPDGLVAHRKVSTIDLVFLTEPFEVETGEGVMVISPETCEHWDGGYFLAYPDDGSKPYSISRSFVRKNYVAVS